MLISPAYAQATAAAPAASGGLAGVLSFAPLILVFAVFWFLMVRPQQKRQRELARAVDAVKKGDQVVTAGGIIGRVTRVEDTHVEVEIAANTRVRVIKATLAEIVGTGAAKPAND
jgi:preprotein translocase subunit YajC